MTDNGESSFNGPQMASPSYRLAALDQDFLLSDSMRGVRFLLEFAKTDEALRAWGVRSTIVVFGSARVRENGDRRHAYWYAEARKFGRIASERGGAIRKGQRQRDNVIATGGGPGLMEAANRGASEAGAPSIGFNITLPKEQIPNPYTTPALTFRFHYFAMRKMHLAMRANALVIFPGGFGTMDEMFEMLTLRQTDKSPRIPIILFDEAYWRDIVNFEKLIEEGMIDARDMELFSFAESAEDVWACLLKMGLTPAKNIELASDQKDRQDEKQEEAAPGGEHFSRSARLRKQQGGNVPPKGANMATPGKGEYGEGNYKASRKFLSEQSEFVKKNKSKIPSMGKAAKAALDGKEGKSLRAAEAKAKSKAHTGTAKKPASRAKASAKKK